jgi:hypothetical protein
MWLSATSTWIFDTTTDPNFPRPRPVEEWRPSCSPRADPQKSPPAERSTDNVSKAAPQRLLAIGGPSQEALFPYPRTR